MSSRAASVDVRRHKRVDGTLTETWSVRFYDSRGRRKRLACRSREHAEFERARVALEGAPAAGGDGSMTVAEFWPVWAADARARIQPETVQQHERVWISRVEPRFGDQRLCDIKPRMVAQWRAELLADGVGDEAVRKAMNLLQAMFTVAVEWGEAPGNPVMVVRKPRQGRRRVVEPLAPEAVEAIRAVMLAAGDDRSATIVSVLAYAGLRPGEMLGLEDRHIRERTVLIDQAVAHGRLKIQKTGRMYRTVDLLAVLREDLVTHQSTRVRRGPLLFGRSDGEPWRRDDWNNWRNRSFLPAARAAGLGRPRPYDLRHSFASLLIREQRVSIVDLADQLGHAPTMTLDTYSHVMREYRGAPPRDAEEWIREARRNAGSA